MQNGGHAHGDHDHGSDALGNPTHDEDFANAARVHGSVVTGSRGWGYVNHSSFVDFTSNVAYDVTRNITYENVIVEGFRYGIQLPERGENVIVSGRLNNVENVVITTAVKPGRSIRILAAVEFETPPNDKTANR